MMQRLKNIAYVTSTKILLDKAGHIAESLEIGGRIKDNFAPDLIYH